MEAARLSYKIDFGSKKEKDRTISLEDGINVFIDPKSSIYLKGVTLDYQDGLMERDLFLQTLMRLILVAAESPFLYSS